MKSLIRIVISVTILIGGAVLFYNWSLNQFNDSLDNLSASYIAVGTLNSVPSRIKKEQVSTTTTEILGTIATSTSTTTTESKSVDTDETSSKPALSFISPQNDSKAYIGCTYKISWKSSVKINSLGFILVDDGTGEAMGPIASGLAKENVTEKDVQNLDWKIGRVWPGEYYISVSKINGIETKLRSKTFTISKIPEDQGADVCKKSSGLF